jgi:hypothetical protein
LIPELGSWADAWWKPVLFVVVAGHMTNVCVTLFLHRSQTHRSVKLHAIAAVPMRLWLWLSTAISTKEWVACHRKHHAFADRDGDPHSPLREGLPDPQPKNGHHHEAHEEHEGRKFFGIRSLVPYPVFVLLRLKVFAAWANFSIYETARNRIFSRQGAKTLRQSEK